MNEHSKQTNLTIASSKSSHASADEVSFLRDQLSDTQSCLHALANFLRFSGIPIPQNIFDNMSRASVASPSSVGIRADMDLENEETAAAFTLEGIAMGRRPDDAFNDEAALLRRKRTDSLGSMGRRPVQDTPIPPTLSTSVPVYCDPPSITTSLDDHTMPFAAFPFTPKSEQITMTKGILQYLPNKRKADILISFYLQHLEWLHKPLHVPTFLSDYAQYWQDMSVGFATDDVDPKWMALYASVLCVATHFGGEYYYNGGFAFGNLDVETRNEKEADTYYQISRSALSQSDFLINHSIEAIQTIIVGVNVQVDNVNNS